uniref:Uncharacterized protein n=1 Tax=viral metagenome TaxID=1070528 RepID=A0A6C0AD46_9ZZZZ
MYSKIQSKYHGVKSPQYTEEELKIVNDHKKLQSENDKIRIKKEKHVDLLNSEKNAILEEELEKLEEDISFMKKTIAIILESSKMKERTKYKKLNTILESKITNLQQKHRKKMLEYLEIPPNSSEEESCKHCGTKLIYYGETYGVSRCKTCLAKLWF